MKKRTVSLILTAVMAVMLAAPVRGAEIGFSDVSDRHYAKDAIQFWAEHGVLSGYTNGTFLPGGTMTRAELAAMLQKIVGYQGRAENVWSDLPQRAWYTDSILALAAQGILTGNAGKMEPQAVVSRQEAFTLLARAIGLTPSSKAPGFADDAAIPAEAMGYLAAMREAGYIREYNGANTIRPTAPITRAEVVSVLSRMIPGYVNVNGTYSADCAGSLLINAGDVTLKDMTVEGDLIVADGVGNGDVYLQNVTVKGDVILRGCGENSFHIQSGSQLGRIVVKKTAQGKIRVVDETGTAGSAVVIEDGWDDVILTGAFASVTVENDVTVQLVNAQVAELTVNAAGAGISNAGTVELLTVNADNVTVTGEKPAEVEEAAGVKGTVLPGAAAVPSPTPAHPSGSGTGTTTTTPRNTPSPDPAPVSPTPKPSSTPPPTKTPPPTPTPALTSTPAPDCKHHLMELVKEEINSDCSGRTITEVCKVCGQMSQMVESIRDGGWHDRVENNDRVEPTCTASGMEATWYCARCGRKYPEQFGGPSGPAVRGVIPALGHDYVNGICTRCGASEDEDLAEENAPMAEAPFDQAQGTDIRPAILLAMGTVVLALYGIDLVSRKRERTK